MAQEITVTAMLAYVNAAVNIPAQTLAIAPPGQFTITGSKFTSGIFNAPTTAGGTIIPLAGLASVGWAFFKNNDISNYVDILTAVTGSGGVACLRLKPGMGFPIYFAPTVTAPAALGNTAPVPLEYLILEI